MKLFGQRIRIDRNELSGAFGDIGTDLPLIMGMLLASGMQVSYVFIAYGLMQIFTALMYGIPMPVQPLKAVAMLVIVQHLPPGVIWGGGLAIGVIMLILTVTGIVDWIAKVIPKVIIRGIQFGLGMQFALLALKEYVGSTGGWGYALAGVAFAVSLVFMGNRRFPPALLIIPAGIVFSIVFHWNEFLNVRVTQIALPDIRFPHWNEIITGLVVLALPQIPLSLGNSIIATHQLAKDYFPEKKVRIRKISLTYSLMNLINPFIGGIPVCHGSGGMAGHYTFGARTGGSVFIYGLLFLTLGLFFSGSFQTVIKVFPMPILGVILFLEGLSLMVLIKDIIDSRRNFMIALITGLMAAGLPYGFLVGMTVGTVIYYLSEDKVKYSIQLKILGRRAK
jgi:hypothetical protein